MKTLRLVIFLLLLSAVALGNRAISSASEEGSDSAEQKRADSWRELKFGLMMHWGLYSVPGGVWNGKKIEGYDEQIKHRARIPNGEYVKLTSQFKAEKFDADFIARLAKEGGMRYVMITSKHHDGFNLWHCKLSRFNAVDATPFKKDAIKLLADACSRQELKFGVYYSLIDWAYPGATPMSDHNSDPITPALEEYSVGQLRELLTGYGPLCEIWFDMSRPTLEQSMRYANLVHRLQPNCMVSGRIFNGQEDFQLCGDNEVPNHWFSGAWESAVTMFHDTWGYRSWQVRENAPAMIREKIRELAFVTARGGNYVMNFGPKGDGSIIEFEAEVIRGVGRWVHAHSDAIFDARPEPYLALDFGYATSRPGQLFLFVKDVPADGVLRIPGWQAATPKAHVLTDSGDNELACSIADGVLAIKLPWKKVDPDLTVVAIDCDSGSAFTPAGLVKFSEHEPTRLLPAKSLAWHRLVGGDYYSLHKVVVGRQWIVQAPQGGRWEVVASRKASGHPAIYLFTAGKSSCQFILPASDKPGRQECGTLVLQTGRPVTLMLQSSTPGREMDERVDYLELRRVP